VDGLPFLLEAHPEIGPEACAREVVTLFQLATARAQDEPSAR